MLKALPNYSAKRLCRAATVEFFQDQSVGMSERSEFRLTLKKLVSVAEKAAVE
jgi:hypothetical protein